MFSKSSPKTPATTPTKSGTTPPAKATSTPTPKAVEEKTMTETATSKPPASVISADLMIKGNLKTTGDIQVLGTIEGDIRAHLLTIGDGAMVKGEVIADDVVVNGTVNGRVRGLKVRLTSTAQVQGDIIHKTIAIESGANFEGSVQRQEDPLATQTKTTKVSAASKAAE
ncbi:MAG: polymer-forming cytoskeletal protein [Pseudomonadota bacterium]